LLAVSRGRARVVPGRFLCLCVSLATLVPFVILREILRALRGKL
jgi:hypothetical protein